MRRSYLGTVGGVVLSAGLLASAIVGANELKRSDPALAHDLWREIYLDIMVEGMNF